MTAAKTCLFIICIYSVRHTLSIIVIMRAKGQFLDSLERSQLGVLALRN